MVMQNWRPRIWRGRILKRARIGDYTYKDLRDTFASQLITAGAPVAWVSTQLGHSDWAITARHYAQWVGGGEYREGVRLEAGELPADILAKLTESPQSPLTWETEGGEADATPWIPGVDEGTRTPDFRDHNPAL